MRKTTVILAALMLAVLGARGAEARVSAIGPDLSRPSDWRAVMNSAVRKGMF